MSHPGHLGEQLMLDQSGWFMKFASSKCRMSVRGCFSFTRARGYLSRKPFNPILNSIIGNGKPFVKRLNLIQWNRKYCLVVPNQNRRNVSPARHLACPGDSKEPKTVELAIFMDLENELLIYENNLDRIDDG